MNTIAVAEDGALDPALELMKAEIESIEEVCSRFRQGSELSRLNARAGQEVAISPLLEEALLAGLRAAALTGGLVDPTLGSTLLELGYSVTFRDVPGDGPGLEGTLARRSPGWQALEHDPVRHTVRIPPGVSLDLGCSGKAWAADRVAREAARALGVGVLVDCGGDLATAGPAPEPGWPVRVTSAEGAADGQDVSLREGGLATSGTTERRWRRGGVELHHILDPATGRPAVTPWTMVTVAGATCLDANAAATAAVILGARAAGWLDALRLPSRLVDRAGRVTLAGGWAA